MCFANHSTYLCTSEHFHLENHDLSMEEERCTRVAVTTTNGPPLLTRLDVADRKIRETKNDRRRVRQVATERRQQ